MRNTNFSKNLIKNKYKCWYDYHDETKLDRIYWFYIFEIEFRAEYRRVLNEIYRIFSKIFAKSVLNANYLRIVSTHAVEITIYRNNQIQSINIIWKAI